MNAIRSIFISLFFISAVYADPAATQALIKDLTAYQEVQGTFLQIIYDQNHTELLKSQGVFALERSTASSGQNGQFYWTTLKPNKQTLVADGKNIYFYDASLQQVTVKKQQGLTNQASPAMLLSGDLQQISKQYQVHYSKNSDQIIYQLTPLKDTFFSHVDLIFHVKNNQNNLSGMEITDGLGQKTHIEFSQLSSTVPASLFHFVIPHGVDVIQAEH